MDKMNDDMAEVNEERTANEFDSSDGENENPMPFDFDSEGGEDDESRGLGFAYIGEGKTASEFTAYIQGYNFGTVPPDYVVLHHTAIPSTLYARYPTGGVWDAGEEGLSEAQIKSRRKGKLDGIMQYYKTTLRWNAGPHLFIDDRYIWLFTPMYEVGIHAAYGNSFKRNGRLHYGIGIEVIGYYEHKRWPAKVEQLVRHAVTTIQQKTRSFELKYMYPGGHPAPTALKWGGISSHRDYNKPTCPGAAITSDYYMSVLRGG